MSMKYLTHKDTIVAIATLFGESALGIIRISGSKSISIIDKIFIKKSKKKLKKAITHTLHYGVIKSKKKV